MQITLNTAESSTDELTALIALLASLGGRLPAGQTITNNVRVGSVIENIDKAIASADAAVERAAEFLEGAEQDDDTPSDSLVDSKGTPWDARIHSESKATVADGSWRKRRGVSDELFAEVMAELADDAPPPPPADEPEGNDEQVPAPPALTEQSAAESAPVAGEAPTSDGQFADFASFVAAVAKHGKTYAELNEMAGVVGVAAFKDLKDHADKWDMFFSMIG